MAALDALDADASLFSRQILIRGVLRAWAQIPDDDLRWIAADVMLTDIADPTCEPSEIGNAPPYGMLGLAAEAMREYCSTPMRRVSEAHAAESGFEKRMLGRMR
jgi:hypothetical protein